MNSKVPSLIQVVDTERTGTYLDGIVFDEMVKFQSKHPTKQKEVSEYILEAVKRDNVDKNCATLTLDSLVDIDILDKEQKMLGFTKKYPTLKFGMYTHSKLYTGLALFCNQLRLDISCIINYFLYFRTRKLTETRDFGDFVEFCCARFVYALSTDNS